MGIEVEPARDAADQAKPGLSLADAADFDFTAVVVVQDVRYAYGEVRLRAFTRQGGGRRLVFTAIGTTSIRAIRYRRAYDKELRRYGLSNPETRQRHPETYRSRGGRSDRPG